MDTRIENPITDVRSLEPSGNQAAPAQTWGDVIRSQQLSWTSSPVVVGQGSWQIDWVEASLESTPPQPTVIWQDRHWLQQQQAQRIYWLREQGIQWEEAAPPMDPDLLVDEGL